jgi:NitT/TauT family transport system substrate-binding protein
MTGKLCLSRATAFAALLVFSGGAQSAEKITLMVGGLEKQIYLPFKLTEQLGYFKDEGLDVELLSQPSGVDAVNEMLTGAVQGVGGFYDHCIDLQAKGKFVQSIVQLNQTPGEVELVSTKHPEIKSVVDFKGKTVGVTGLGSSTYFLTQYLAVKHGLKLDEFATIPVGGGATFVAAMQQDKIQVGMTTEPTVSRMLKTGDAKILVDLRSPDKTKEALGGLYPGASLYVSAAWLEGHKKEAQKLANALVKTLRFIDKHTPEEIADKMPADYYAGDKALYIKALAEGKGMYTADGVMPIGGPETVYAVLSGFSKNVQNKKVNLAQTFTTEFVKNVKWPGN